MWKKDLKTFVIHLWNNKLYSAITVLGFAISLTFVILLSVYIKNEFNVNTAQLNKDRIYRVTNEQFGGFPPPLGQRFQDKVPEIECYTRIYEYEAIISNEKGEKLNIDFLMADSTFFKMFTFNLIEGNKENALKARNSIVLTKEFAYKLFGDESPIGKQVTLNTDIVCTITGIVEDVSKTSNFEKKDAIVNFRVLADLWSWKELLTSYGNCSFSLYLMAKPNTQIRDKVPELLADLKTDFWIYKQARAKELHFELLDESYFSTKKSRGITQNSLTLIKVLSAIVLLILILAIINYMNLTIAQSGMRVKETAIKKLVGSSKKRLFGQFLFESVFITFLSFFIALLFSFLLEPVFNNLLNTNLELENQFIAMHGVFAFAIVLIIGIISGLIPAFIITKLNAVEVIKGIYRRKQKSTYSTILIGFQYTVVIVLLISTLFISKQTNFLKNYDMGIRTKNVLWFENHVNYKSSHGLKSKLLQIAGVKNVSFVAGSPLDKGNNWSFTYKEQPVSFQKFVVDSTFFSVFNIDAIETGASFSKSGIWMNQKGIQTLNLDILPTSVTLYEEVVPILGVVNDFNFGPLHAGVEPLIIEQITNDDFPWNFFVEIEGANSLKILGQVKQAYLDYTGGLPFGYGFMDDTVADWYKKEQNTAKIVGYFAFLTIVIASMGIFAMSIFYIQQKIKEIGVRKVIGARVIEIVKMLNKDFIIWLFIAFFIAIPIGYFTMKMWLQDFAYKTTLSWWVFALAGLFTMILALATISLQTIRVARKNPVEALRYE